MTGVKGGDANTFLELATERFEARVGRPATPEELTWTFDKIQVRFFMPCLQSHACSESGDDCMI